MSITYSYLSQKIIDSEAPSEEILDTLSAQQKIEVLKLCYNSQRKLLNKLLEEKRIEQAIIEIPTIQPPKRDKNQSSKIKLWELCPWLPKTYFANIKADFTPHIRANKIVYNKHKVQIGSNKWIVQECLKQKLMDRADNFRRKQYKKQNIKSNVQIGSNVQEFELRRLSTYYNKENTNLAYASDIESDDSNHEANTSNLKYLTAELHKNYDHSSNDKEIAKTNDEEE
ncbi:6426_t:CDS:2, partial [Racocetra fulgida]